MLRILIADDHSVVRNGVRHLLTNTPDTYVTGEADSGQNAITLLEQEQWDLLLLDIGLPDLNGLEVLKRVKRTHPDLPVLMFSMFAEDDYAMAALEAGAAGYLAKDSEPEEIREAIDRAARGERYFSVMLAEKLISGSTGRRQKLPHESLSEREFTVMRLISRGTAIVAIAKVLYLSPKTVTTYRTRVLEKLGLSNNAEIARYVIEHKLDK